MIDHMSLSVSDFSRAKAFYSAALAPLGYATFKEFPAPGGGVLGLGIAGQHADFWIAGGARCQPSMHLAFAATDHASVEAFHRAALAAGGRDNGGPGIRAQYHPSYYAAFVLDPDGNNIEAVCHAPGRPADQKSF